jgi:hypothetical protein
MNEKETMTLKYEPPDVEVLGTLAELTAGNQGTPSSDSGSVSIGG